MGKTAVVRVRKHSGRLTSQAIRAFGLPGHTVFLALTGRIVLNANSVGGHRIPGGSLHWAHGSQVLSGKYMSPLSNESRE